MATIALIAPHPVPARTAQTVWTIDPAHTGVEFAVRHLMISTVKGRFAGVTGTGDRRRRRSRRGQPVDITIDAATIDTREAQRDAHLEAPPTSSMSRRFRRSRSGAAARPNSPRGHLQAGRQPDHPRRHSRGRARRDVFRVIPRTRGATSDRALPLSTKIKRSDYGLVWNPAARGRRRDLSETRSESRSKRSS